MGRYQHQDSPSAGPAGNSSGDDQRLCQNCRRAATGVDPKELSADISFALWTTAAGMAISIPLIVIQGSASNGIKKLQENIDEGTGTFLDSLAEAKAKVSG